MLKKRISACVIYKDGIVVQSIGFNRYLPVGSPEVTVEFLSEWGIDEIIFLDIRASLDNRGPDFDLIKRISKKCFVPLLVGGGIRNIEDMKLLIHCGADKISINKLAFSEPNIINESAEVLGSQCIVVSMDIRSVNGKYIVFTDSGRKSTGLGAVERAKEIQRRGAGEIFLTSIDKDGTKSGLDLELTKLVSNSLTIPVIACGGVGHPRHFSEGLIEGNVSAVAAGNFFHFTEHSPIVSKAFLLTKDIKLRLDTYANYRDFHFDKEGRLEKRQDSYLEKILFEYCPKEII